MGGWVGPVLTGLGALSGALNKNPVTTTTPQYDPTNQAFRDYLISALGQQTNPANEATFGNAYKLGGVLNFRNASMGTNNSLQTALAMRGLGRTTAGVNTVGDTGYRAGSSIADFLNQAVMNLANRHTQNLQSAADYQKSIPVGSRTVGTNPAGTGFTGALQGGVSTAAGYLGQMSAQSNFTKALKAAGIYNGGGSGGGSDPWTAGG
jgi:hypothetical protein